MDLQEGATDIIGALTNHYQTSGVETLTRHEIVFKCFTTEIQKSKIPFTGVEVAYIAQSTCSICPKPLYSSLKFAAMFVTWNYPE